jgi:hypothetical protein
MNERLNIRRMQMPEKQSREDLLFDPLREITQRDWSQIKSYLEGQRNKDLAIHARMVAYMRVMNPRSSVNLSESDAKRLPELMKSYADQSDWAHFLWTAAACRMLRPVTQEFDSGEEVYRGIHGLLQSNLDEEHWSSLATHLMEARIAAPDARWDFPQHALPQARRWAAAASHSAEEITSFAYFAGAMRVVLPEEKIGTDLAAWRLMRAELNHLKDIEAWDFFTYHAFYMTLLGVQDVRVTNENGLEVTQASAKKESEMSPMPDQLTI